MARTPGPWSYMQDGEEPYWSIGMAGGNPNSGHAMVYTNEADARLMAAAPELLSALKAHLPWDEEYGPVQGWGIWQDAIDAINKAEGRAE